MQYADPSLSLLSLSIAAANAEPIEVPQESAFDNDDYHPWRGVAVHNGTKHRRLSSTGQARRRLSDARDAASRPSVVGLHTATIALNSLASLSISSIPVHGAPVARRGVSSSVPVDDGFSVSGSPPASMESKPGVTGLVTRNGKKRGTIFTCESCSKVYRHPSCLIKHRWEHTPHWREASKFLLSKHQQVQLMEAAAILSHLTPSASGGSSLPDDRSLWPSYLSGGTLPPPLPASDPTAEAVAQPISSSVPSGPRIHDYALPSTSVSGITRLRPGIIAVPTEPESYSQQESGAPQSYTTSYGSLGVESLTFASSYQSSSMGVIVRHPRTSGSSERWSPSSDESEFVEVEADATPSGGFSARGRFTGEGEVSVKEEEEEEGEWDGMEMEMEL
ncbi:hypothetical protein H4582DRAFT_2110275 [Lactarius indigo]|nr:hypothetical protein H4582DRAFT_2110275 [Lactarius indigo]